MGMTINTSGLSMRLPAETVPVRPVADPGLRNAVLTAEAVGEMAAGLVESYAKAKESQAKARKALAEAEALLARADLARIKEDLEDFIFELEEKIRLMEKLLTKEGDDIRAEEHVEEHLAGQIAESIEEISEKTETLVAGFEPRREEILKEKREVCV